MFESVLHIDIGKDPDHPRPGRHWLRNIYHVHQRLCMAFPSEHQIESDPEFLKPFQPEGFSVVHVPRSPENNFLYRIDPCPGGRVKIIVRSALKPNWEYAFHNAEYLLVKNVAPKVRLFTISVEPNEIYCFELVANPTRKICTYTKQERLGLEPPRADVKKNGMRVPVRQEQLLEWLESRMKEAGVEIVAPPTTANFFYRFVKPSQKSPGKIFTVRFRGKLKVRDPELLSQALIRGIGPAKSFGCGLLTLRPSSPR